jgi:GH24 family phage-related lysozyme (muramidase)
MATRSTPQQRAAEDEQLSSRGGSGGESAADFNAAMDRAAGWLDVTSEMVMAGTKGESRIKAGLNAWIKQRQKRGAPKFGRTKAGDAARLFGKPQAAMWIDRFFGKYEPKAQRPRKKVEGGGFRGGGGDASTARISGNLLGIKVRLGALTTDIADIKQLIPDIKSRLGFMTNVVSDMAGSINDINDNVSDIKSLLMPKDLLAKGRLIKKPFGGDATQRMKMLYGGGLEGDELDKQKTPERTINVRYDPLAPVGEQFRVITAKGKLTSRKPNEGFTDAATKNAALATAKLALKIQKKDDEKEAAKTELKKKRAYKDPKETDPLVATDPVLLLRSDMEKNFKKLFDLLEDGVGGGLKEIVENAALGAVGLGVGAAGGAAAAGAAARRARGVTTTGATTKTKGGGRRLAARIRKVGGANTLKTARKILKFIKRIPLIGYIASAALLIYDIQKAIEQNEQGKIDDYTLKRVIIKALGAAIGGVGGAELGAAILGAAGTFIAGPVGTFLGGVAGAIGGFVYGQLYGMEAAEMLFDYFTDNEIPNMPKESAVEPKLTAAAAGGSILPQAQYDAEGALPPMPRHEGRAGSRAPRSAGSTTGTLSKEVPVSQKMNINDEEIKRKIKQNESLSLTPYPDAAGYSIGYGHYLGDGALPPEWNRTISKEEAEALFEKDYAIHKAGAERIPGYDKLNARGKAALIDLAYNMGPNWVKEKGFTTFEKHMSQPIPNIEGAARSLENSKWYGQVGKRGLRTVSDLRAGLDTIPADQTYASVAPATNTFGSQIDGASRELTAANAILPSYMAGKGNSVTVNKVSNINTVAPRPLPNAGSVTRDSSFIRSTVPDVFHPARVVVT